MNIKHVAEDMIQRVNSTHGKGMVSKIVWSVPFAGVPATLSGVVVRQFQYGMDAKRFNLYVNGKGTYLKFLKQKRMLVPKTEYDTITGL